jgi:hypothetical protein
LFLEILNNVLCKTTSECLRKQALLVVLHNKNVIFKIKWQEQVSPLFGPNVHRLYIILILASNESPILFAIQKSEFHLFLGIVT